MGKKSPKAPPAPDPVAISNAQTASNIATAQEQQRLNMVNTTGPDGSVNYAADPTAPGGYRQTTTLSPELQGLQSGAYNLAGTAVQNAQGALGQPASEILHVLRGETSLRGLRGLNGLPTGGEPFEIDQLMFCLLLYLGWRNNQLLQLDPSLL
jgi:hypothetical protein